MKIPQICLTLVKVGVIIFLGSFLSCGHSPAVKEGDLFAGMKDESAPLADTLGETTGEPPAEAKADTGKSVLDDIAAKPADDKKVANILDATTSEPPTMDLLASAGDKLSEPKPLEANPPLTELPPMPANPAPELVAPTPDAMPQAAATPANPDPIIPNLTANEPMPGFTATETPAQPAKAAAPKTKRVQVTAATKAPTQPVTVGKLTLNRFYLLRQGDTPASVSQLLFATTANDKDLVAANKGEWKPGRRILYVSPEQPEDNEMLSFYEENGINTEEYEVKKGDWLSKIAKQKYGHVGSWAEIALANGLKSPNQLKKGQKLVLYPATLEGYSKPEAPAETAAIQPVAKPTQNELASQKPAIGTSLAQAKPDMDDILREPAFEEPKKDVAKKGVKETKVKRPEPSLASAEVGGFIEQNLFALAVACVAFVLIFWLFMLRRRRDAEF